VPQRLAPHRLLVRTGGLKDHPVGTLVKAYLEHESRRAATSSHCEVIATIFVNDLTALGQLEFSQRELAQVLFVLVVPEEEA